MDKDIARMVIALQAILARAQGQWDHPALLKFGELHTLQSDVIRIAKHGLDNMFNT